MKINRVLMKKAVGVKRILTGNSAQTRYTEYLEEIQYKTPEELKYLQAVSLCELMKHAVTNIPNYKYLSEMLELTPEKAFEDIKKFPVVTKADLLERRNDFIDIKTAVSGSFNSSGTQGEKTKVLTDRYFTDHAVDEYFNKVIGIVPGMRRLLVSHLNPKKRFGKFKKISYIANPIKGVYRLDYTFLDENKYKKVLKLFTKGKLDIIWGSSHGIYALAKYINDMNLKAPKVSLALCGGTNLLLRYKTMIQRTLGADVYDRYASVESGNFANQCKIKDGYHYIPTVHYIEIMDNNMVPVREGEAGAIYITTLTKRAMPLIRYKMGDRVIKTDKLCSCGCRFPIIAGIEGREKEGIFSPKGTYISNGPMYEIIEKSGKIDEFQAFQTEPGSILLKLVCEKEQLTDSEIDEISLGIYKCLDYKMNITVEYTNEIKPLPNGKIIRIFPLERQKDFEGTG